MKKFWKKHRQNNQGLTLIEMVITVAIIGIVSVVVLSIVSTGANFYRGMSGRTKSQMDLQELMDDVENIIMNADDSISLSTGENGAVVLTVVNRYDSSGYTDTLEWIPSEKKIYHTRVTIGTEEVYKDVARSAIAENVVDFSIDMKHTEKNRTVEFQATVNNRGKEDSASCTVHLRNAVEIKEVWKLCIGGILNEDQT